MYDSELAGFEAFSLGCTVDPRSSLGLSGKHFDANRLLLDLGFVVETHNPHCSPVAVRHFSIRACNSAPSAAVRERF